jgi:hypothetical protein
MLKCSFHAGQIVKFNNASCDIEINWRAKISFALNCISSLIQRCKCFINAAVIATIDNDDLAAAGN